MSTLFSPHQALADALLARLPDVTDGAHDLAHLGRVWRNVQRISAVEGGDGDLLLAATVLHDGVHVPKDDPRRSSASRLAAEQARGILEALSWEDSRIEAVAHAIEAHSFSAGIAPQTLEAGILQDADRLDALGALGIARCFYTAGQMGSALYDPLDPQAAARALDDRRFTLDHFQTKLLTLRAGFRTATGQQLAEARHARLVAFRDALLEEIGDV
ncbi:HD domain-containing protein [Kushneria sp. AK178]